MYDIYDINDMRAFFLLGSGTCRFVTFCKYGLNPTVFSWSFIVHVSRTETYAKKYLGERAYVAAIGVVDESDCHLVLETDSVSDLD